MAKNDKGKEVPVKKGAAKKETAVEPVVESRLLSPLRAWEREIDRMFENFPLLRWPRWHDLEPFRFPRELRMQVPSLDMYEEKDEIVVKAELPGINKDDVEVNLAGSTLTIKGEKKREEEIKKADYHRSEREYGSIYRSIALPADVKADEVKATFKDGVLEVRLPKTEEAKQKAVRVKVQ